MLVSPCADCTRRRASRQGQESFLSGKPSGCEMGEIDGAIPDPGSLVHSRLEQVRPEAES